MADGEVADGLELYPQSRNCPLVTRKDPSHLTAHADTRTPMNLELAIASVPATNSPSGLLVSQISQVNSRLMLPVRFRCLTCNRQLLLA